MSEHTATISWAREAEDFSYQCYTRDHVWSFPSGISISASAAPNYLGNKDLVDPEEAFVASICSCHMLTFLAIASRKKYTVDEYTDQAVGFLEEDESGKFFMTKIILDPKVVFVGPNIPSKQQIKEMHNIAHNNCFIANSVKTKIVIKDSCVPS